MDYIINPKIFYWMNVLDNFKITIGILIAALSIAIISDVIVIVVNYFEGRDYKDCKDEDGNPTDSDWRNFLLALKILKCIAPIFVVLVLLVIFIPSKEAMIEMLIAKFATVENVNGSIDALKSVVDYIVEAIGSLK